MRVEVSHRDQGVMVIAVSGRVDSLTTGEFEKRVLPALDRACTSVVIDFSRLDYINSCGIRVLLLALRKARASATAIHLSCPHGRVREVLAVTGLGRLFEFDAAIPDPPPRTEAVPVMEWSDIMSVGSDAIDDDHRAMIDILNTLTTACYLGQDRAVIIDIVDSFVTVAERHFAHEEEIMRAAGYPDIAQHVGGHIELLTHLHEFRRMSAQGPAHRLGKKAVAYLHTWLRDQLRDDIAVIQRISEAAAP